MSMLSILAGLLSPVALLVLVSTPSGSDPTELRPPTWTFLKGAYSYSLEKPLDPQEETKPATDAVAFHITFTGANGQKVPGAFLRPKKEGKYPVVLLLHGLTSDKETMLISFGIPLVKQGVAVLALDAPYHGERKSKDVDQRLPSNFGVAVHEGARDYRRAMDWLAKRADIDIGHVGLIGYSMGAITGAILAGVDERVKASVLCVGGDPIISYVPSVPEAGRNEIYTICPSLYIGHISPRPVLMLNGKEDLQIVEAASKRLYDSAKDPRQQIYYHSGHILPADAVQKAYNWVAEKLKFDKDQG